MSWDYGRGDVEEVLTGDDYGDIEHRIDNITGALHWAYGERNEAMKQLAVYLAVYDAVYDAVERAVYRELKRGSP